MVRVELCIGIAVFKCFAVFLAMIGQSVALGQVVNNDISHRSELVLNDKPLISSTDLASVEWDCVNKKLTNKCLQYHNDQWFTFKVPYNGIYYINITSQQCRKDFGIQAIVIEGNPCEIKTYHILKCIPKIRNQNINIELDSLETNTQYLINIDGFLGDFCTFGIQLSSRPNGFPLDARNLKAVDLNAVTDGNVNNLKWKSPMGLEDSLLAFGVYRSIDKVENARFLEEIPLVMNARGTYQPEYYYRDSLTKDQTVIYEIVGRYKSGKEALLDQRVVAARMATGPVLDFSLEFKQGDFIQLLLIDKLRDQVLEESSFTFEKALDKHKKMHVGIFATKGISEFVVRAVNLKTHRKQDFEFSISNGTVVRR